MNRQYLALCTLYQSPTASPVRARRRQHARTGGFTFSFAIPPSLQKKFNLFLFSTSTTCFGSTLAVRVTSLGDVGLAPTWGRGVWRRVPQQKTLTEPYRPVRSVETSVEEHTAFLVVLAIYQLPYPKRRVFPYRTYLRRREFRPTHSA